MKKRVVSICLSLAMLLALTVPLSAFAAEAGEVPEELPIGTEPAETSDPLTPELSQLPEPDAEPDMSAPQAQPEMQMPPETEEPEAELPEDVPSVAEPPAEETPAVFAEEQEQEEKQGGQFDKHFSHLFHCASLL